MRLKFLGSADSAGIPVHNCSCSVCNDYRNKNKKNLSTCAYLQVGNQIILLDAGHDDLAFKFDGKNIGAVFLTHFHADHCLGLLRLRHSSNTISCYHPKDKEGFSDLFKHNHCISYNTLDAFESIYVEQIQITAVPLQHSKNTMGYLIEYNNHCIAYLTDCFALSKESFVFLQNKNIDFAFIDACYDESIKSENHFNYEQASGILDRLNVKNGYLMHVSHNTQEYIQKNNIKLSYAYVQANDEFLFE